MDETKINDIADRNKISGAINPSITATVPTAINVIINVTTNAFIIYIFKISIYSIIYLCFSNKTIQQTYHK